MADRDINSSMAISTDVKSVPKTKRSMQADGSTNRLTTTITGMGNRKTRFINIKAIEIRVVEPLSMIPSRLIAMTDPNNKARNSTNLLSPRKAWVCQRGKQYRRPIKVAIRKAPWASANT